MSIRYKVLFILFVFFSLLFVSLSYTFHYFGKGFLDQTIDCEISLLQSVQDTGINFILDHYVKEAETVAKTYVGHYDKNPMFCETLKKSILAQRLFKTINIYDENKNLICSNGNIFLDEDVFDGNKHIKHFVKDENGFTSLIVLPVQNNHKYYFVGLLNYFYIYGTLDVVSNEYVIDNHFETNCKVSHNEYMNGYLVYYKYDQKLDGCFVTVFDYKRVYERTITFRNKFVISLLVIFLLFFIILMFLTRKFISPLKNFTEKVKEISKGNVNVEIKEKERDDEIGDLARAFDRLLVSLKLAMKMTSPELAKDKDALKKLLGEKEKMEKELKFNEQRYKALIDNSIDAIIGLDKNMNVSLWNKAAEKMFGYKEKEILGKSILKIVPRKYWDKKKVAFEKFLKTGKGPLVGKIVPIDALTKNRKKILINLSISKKINRDDLVVIAMVRERGKEEKLKKEKQIRDNVLEAIADATNYFLNMTNTNDLRKRVDKALAKLGSAVGVSRTYIFKKDLETKDDLIVSQVFEWVNKGIKPQIKNPKLQKASMKDLGFKRWVKILKEGRVINDIIKNMPASERKLLEEQDIKSILVVPIFSDNKLWGFIGFDDCINEKKWSKLDVKALKTAANIFGIMLYNAKF